MMDIPYTRDQSAIRGWVTGWSVLFFVEGLVVGTVILIFVPVPWLKLLLTATLAAGIVWFIARHLCAPLRTQHALTDATLELRYGPARITIPRAHIASAEPTSDTRGSAFVAQPEWDAAAGTIRLPFSRQGQIRLRLDPPVEFARREGSFTAREVLFNADDRDAVLAVLLGETVDQTPAPPPAIVIPAAPRLEPVADLSGRPVAIEAIGLAKAYGDFHAVHPLDLRIHRGEIYGFIGPNGAGKTTTISMLVGLLAPSSGTIRIAGHDLVLDTVAAKTALGYVPDRPVLYDTLTGREFLEFIAQMRGLSREDAGSRIDELLTALDLRHRADELCRTWSFGMRNKLALAAAMLHRPQVLILDEPFNGLDPQTSASLRGLIIEQAREGTCVLLSTHDLALVERMCHRVGIMSRGHLIAEGAPATIREQAEDLEAAFLSLTSEEPAR